MKTVTQTDIRDSDAYRRVEFLAQLLTKPGSGLITDALEVEASPDGATAAFSAVIWDELIGSPTSRIALTNLHSGETTVMTGVMTGGPGSDRLPRWAPDGSRLAFLADQSGEGDFQLCFLDPDNGEIESGPPVAGWIEYLAWSNDGTRILLGVAGHGAHRSGGQGAIASRQESSPGESWMPEVRAGEEAGEWRSIWLYDLRSDAVRKLPVDNLNIWEAAWCGDDRIAAITSPSPGEEMWYTATLDIIDPDSGSHATLYRPGRQLGWPSASPSGERLAIVEACCSDRWVVAGELLVFDTRRMALVARVDSNNVDVAYTHWRTEDRLLFAGPRDFEMVVGEHDIRAGSTKITWASEEITASWPVFTPKIAPFGSGPGDCLLMAEGFTRAPEIAAIRAGQIQTIKSFDRPELDVIYEGIESAQPFTWQAPDGLEIHGWLLLPPGEGPFPLVMEIHGGPVASYHPTWAGHTRLNIPTFLTNGYALFCPNVRGSSGRGQAYAEMVVGDMGGVDTQDYLSGLDALVERGIADPQRLAVCGVSYGGFMTSWLVTQDSRFAAAVSICPTTNWVSTHLTSNIPHFVALFLGDEMNRPDGKYFTRSPVMFADRVETPVLHICGALDRCTPPGQALEFHNALLEQGVESVLVTYPEEGHGIRKLPAQIDHSARMLEWFKAHMPA